MCPSAPTPGILVGGRYRLEQMLVQGGMGNVWKAQHVSLNAPVAIKFISPLIAEDEEALGRFLLEAQSAAALRSSHIVQVFDFGIDEGTPFIAMELLQGESLAERLRRLGTLSALESGRVLSHVARGIQYAHTTGIVHRDLKPDNIFIATEGDHEVSKVLDFGIAKALSKAARGQSSAQTRAGSLLGSPYYVSPEQAEGDRDIDHRSDLWALGIITFECLTGRRPFESESLAGLLVKICTQPSPRPSECAKVPAGFDEWFARATEKDRSRRFQSARELIDGYAKLLSSASTDLAEIRWPASSESPAGARRESSDAPAAATLNSTPHRAAFNDSALAVTPSIARKGSTRRNWPSAVGAVLLLLVAGAIGKMSSRSSHESEAGRPMTENASPMNASAGILQSASSEASAHASSSLKVTPIAPTTNASVPRSSPAPAVVRRKREPIVSESKAEVAPSSVPSTASSGELFRDRKLPAETR